MDSEAAPEMEMVQGEVLEEIVREDDSAEAQQKTPNSKNKKGRKWEKVTNLADFYSPVPYTSATKGGGRGKGAKGSGKGDFEEGGRKGKGKGAYFQEGEAPAKPAEDAAQSPPSSVAPGPVAADGENRDGGKGGVNAKKKQMGKNREGGKGGAGGKGGGGGSGGGKGAQQVPRKGGAGKGGPRGPSQPNDMPEVGPETEGPRAPGPQQRLPVPAKGVAPGGMAQMPVAGMPYGMPGMPYGFAGAGMPMAPYAAAMPAMYAMPYYVMPQMGQQMHPYGMPAAPPAIVQPALTAADRASVTSQVQKQIEYYFGIENLLKDVFLRKHMTDEGFVPIALLAGFRRIQDMTCDVSILMEAITTSELVEANSQNTHIRLRGEWQRWILAPQPATAVTAPATEAPQPAIRSTP